MGNSSTNNFELNILGLGAFPIELQQVLNGNINIEHKIYDYSLNGYGRGYMLYGDVLVRYVDKNGKEISKNDYFYDRVNNNYIYNLGTGTLVYKIR